MTVYKYYPPTRYTMDALLNNYFFFNKVSKQNDPYDASFKLIQSPQYIDALLGQGMHPCAEQIMKDYGTCSFAQHCNNKHMWAFYTENYHGLTIGFEEKYLCELSQVYMVNIPYVKVTYENKLPDFDDHNASFLLQYIDETLCAHQKPIKFCDALKNRKLLDDLFVYICSLKEAETWEEEKERRLVAAGHVIKKENRERMMKKGIGFLPNGYTIPFPKEAVTEIIIGHNCSLSIGDIMRITNKYKNVEIKQTSCEKPFSIDIIPYNNNSK